MKTICLDFDGVLHSYPEWKGETVIDEPVPGAQSFCARLIAAGFRVVIQSTRGKTPEGRAAITAWLKEWDFPFMDVVVDKPMAVLTVDDRAFRFTGDFDAVLEFAKTDMEPWNR